MKILSGGRRLKVAVPLATFEQAVAGNFRGRLLAVQSVVSRTLCVRLPVSCPVVVGEVTQQIRLPPQTSCVSVCPSGF